MSKQGLHARRTLEQRVRRGRVFGAVLGCPSTLDDLPLPIWHWRYGRGTPPGMACHIAIAFWAITQRLRRVCARRFGREVGRVLGRRIAVEVGSAVQLFLHSRKNPEMGTIID